MRGRFVAIALLLFVAGGAAVGAPRQRSGGDGGESGGDVLAAARIEFEAGRPAQARELLTEAFASGRPADGEALHAAGVCAAAMGAWAEAVVDLRRAAIRAPRDGGVAFDLRRAELALAERSPSFVAPVEGERKGAPVLARLEGLVPRWSPAEWLLALGLLHAVGWIAWWIGRVRSGRAAARAGGLLVVVALIGGGVLFAREALSRSDAIVLRSRLDLRQAPASEAPTSGTLLLGEVVRVREERDDWVRVSAPAGSGWVQAEGVGIVD